MKKAAKKFVSSIIILLIAGIAVFVIGWSNIYINPGEYGIMISKTSGLYNKAITAGDFTWKWERLLPTNVSLRCFSLAPYVSHQSISGSLPSGSIYSAHLDDHPDFGYRIELDISLTVREDKLVYLVQKYDLKSQSELEDYLESNAALASQCVIDYVLLNQEKRNYISVQALNAEQIKEIISSNEDDFKFIDLIGVEITSAKLPDFEMYYIAKDSFVAYQKALDSSMQQRVEEQAAQRVEEDRTIEQLERFAILLGKYPQLEDLSKNGNINEIINTLRSLKN